MWSDATITDVGSNLLAAWITGSTLNITRAAAGTGTVDDLYSATSLYDERQQMSIVSVDRKDGNVIVKLQATAAEEAYTMNQIGVWANVDGGETGLLAIFQDTVGIAVPQATTSEEFIYNFFATLVVNNRGSMNVTIDSSAAVTMETLNAAIADKQDRITAVGLLKRGADGRIVAAEEGVDYDTGTGSYHGTSPTAAATALKTAEIEDLIDLTEGALFILQFENGNSAANPYLKINDLTPHPIVSPGQSTLAQADYWKAGEFCLLMLDGEKFVLLMRLIRYIPIAQKGVAGGVATLEADGKVTSAQLRGGIVYSENAPTDTTLLWIDKNRVARFYDAQSASWKTVLPTWG